MYHNLLSSDPMSCNTLSFSAIAAGLVTCIASRDRSIRGDYAALAVTCVVAVLYWLFGQYPMMSDSGPTSSTAIVVLAYALTTVLITVLYRLSPWHPLASYPGPFAAKLTSLWLVYISYTGKRCQALEELHRVYGPFVRIGPKHMSINSASAVSLYLNAEKSEAYRYPGHNGVVALFFKQDTPELHRGRKRAWQGFFTPTSIASLIQPLARRTWELVETLDRRQAQDPHGVIDLAEATNQWSHDYMGDIVFGGCNALDLLKNGDPHRIVDTGKEAAGLFDCISHAQWLLDILWRIPATENMHSLESLAAQMTQARVKSKDLPEFRDLTSYLLEAEIPQNELEADSIVAIMGGSDSTSAILALSVYRILAHRAYYDLLRKELFEAFPDPMAHIDMDELASLPILNGVINETLRLYSSDFNGRIVPDGGMVIDGNFLPGGTIAALAARAIQMSPEHFFPVPEEFRPERWSPQGLGPATVTNKAVLTSFSFGPHYCMGKTLAYHQMRYALTRLILAFDMEFEEGFDPEAFNDGLLNMRTVLMKKKLRISVKRRPGVDLEKHVI
ncbi:cytochrome P450 [Cubamyces lactineus]|nr:cytochrome P450 [Cubamyces lactineus]